MGVSWAGGRHCSGDLSTRSAHICSTFERYELTDFLQDTWTAWVDSANTAVIEASDFLGNDAYAYFQGVSIDNGAASDAYWAAVNQVRDVSQGKWVWTTETGWPQSGPTVGNAVPSVDALQTFWWQVACSSFDSLPFFWYDLDDFLASPSFAVVGTNYDPVIDMTCG
jgi:hypothetical protein